MFVVKDETLNVSITADNYRTAVRIYNKISNSKHLVAMYELTNNGLQLVDYDRHSALIMSDIGPKMGVMS